MTGTYRAWVYLYQRRSSKDFWGRRVAPGSHYCPKALFSTRSPIRGSKDPPLPQHTVLVIFAGRPELEEQLPARVQFISPIITPTPVFHLMEGDRITGQVVLEEPPSE